MQVDVVLRRRGRRVALACGRVVRFGEGAVRLEDFGPFRRRERDCALDELVQVRILLC